MSRRRPARTDDVVQDRLAHPNADGGDPCPGPCNHAFRDAETAAAEEAERAHAHHNAHGDGPCDPTCSPDQRITQHDTPFHPGKPVWCVDVPAFNARGELIPDRLEHEGCTGKIRRDLAALEPLALDLAPGRLNTGRDTDVDDNRGGSNNARSAATFPSLSPGWDALDDLIRWLVTVEDDLRAHLGHPPNPGSVTGHGRRERTLSSALGYLLDHLGPLLASPQSATVGRQIRHRRRTLRKLTGTDHLTHKLAGECPACRRRGRLYREDGDDLVRCGGADCNAVWDWGHYQWLIKQLVAGEKGRVSA